MTFRSRLALALASFAVLFSTAIGALTVTAAENVVDTEIDRSLLATSTEFDQELVRELRRAQELREGGATIGSTLKDSTSKQADVAEDPTNPTTYALRERLSDPSVVVQIFALDGSVVSAPLIRPIGIDADIPVEDNVLTTYKGQRVYLIRRDVYTVIFSRSLRPRDEIIGDLVRRTVLTGGAGLIGAFTIAFLLARRLSRRLDDLANSAHAAVEGSTTSLDVEGADEIAELAKVINSLIGSVKGAADRQKQLFRYAGHELRTPLTAAMLNADILLRHHDSLNATERRALLATLREQLASLEHVSDEVSEIAAGVDRNVEPTEIDLLSYVREQVAGFAAAHQRDVNVTGAEVVVVADPSHLQRIIENLLSNAVKYGTESIDVTVSSDTRNGVISVRDHGAGFPEDEPSVLLEPFRRGRDTQSIPGSGLGLAIVADLVRSASGTITLANHQAGGAIVTVTLPRSSS